MNFLHPGLAIAALASISIPILIHLLMRRRRRPIPWAAMRFLLEAYRQHRRRLRLEQWLLLAARCLMVALAGTALARPYFGATSGARRGPRTLVLAIDNGLASGAIDASGSMALDRHRDLALGAIDDLDAAAGDRVAILAMGAPAEALVVPPTSDLGAASAIVRDLTPTDSATDPHATFAAIASSLGIEEAPGITRVLVLSDARAGSADIQRPLPVLPRAREIELRASRPAEEGLDNVAITSVRPRRPVLLLSGGAGASQQILARVTLARFGPGVAGPAVSKILARIEADGRSSAQGEVVVRWAPGQSEAAATVDLTLSSSVTIPRAIIRAEIDRDGLPADNTWRCPIEARDLLRVGIAAPRRFASGALSEFDPADWIERALSPADDAPDAPQIISFDPASLDASRLAGLDAIVLTRPDAIQPDGWPLLRQFADAGGLVVVLPPAGVGVHLWPDALDAAMDLDWSVAREPFEGEAPAAIAVDRDAPAHPLLGEIAAELAELSRPVSVRRWLPVEIGPESPDRVLDLDDGRPLLLAAAPGARDSEARGSSRGLVVLFTTSLSFEWTDLHAKPMIVPLVQEIVRQGIGVANGSWSFEAGRAPAAPARAVELRPLDADLAPLAADTRGEFPPLRRSGAWRAVDERGADRGLIAINPDTSGSRTQTLPPQAIESWLAAAAPTGRVDWIGPEHEPASASSASPTPAGAGRLVPILLACALVITLGELVMARRFSHAGEAA